MMCVDVFFSCIRGCVLHGVFVSLVYAGMLCFSCVRSALCVCVNSGVCVWILCVLVYVCIGVCMFCLLHGVCQCLCVCVDSVCTCVWCVFGLCVLG